MLARTNSAFEIGRTRFPWWPDWREHYCAIIACGPSAKDYDLSVLDGKVKVMAIKEAVDLAPFADVVYGCDAPWWQHRQGLPKFKGLKFSFDPRVRQQFPDIIKIEIPERKMDRLRFDDPLAVGSGGNSGFQALNLAAQFSPKGIILIGFDMNASAKVHYYGRNMWPMANNPAPHNFKRWREAMSNAAVELSARSVEVINCSMQSAVDCFRKMTLDKALCSWGLNS